MTEDQPNPLFFEDEVDERAALIDYDITNSATPSKSMPVGSGSASLAGSIINLTNTILGAGMLALPAAFAKVGIIFGMFLIFIGGLGSSFGLKLLVECARWTKEPSTSYFVVAQHTYPKAVYVIDFAVAIKCFGVAISYLIVVGDLMPPAIKYIFDVSADSVAADRKLWVGIAFAIVLPLSLMKSLNSLRFTSLIALFTVVYVIIMVIVYFFLLDADSESHLQDVVYWKWDVGLLQALPVVVFSYTCHQNVFSIYSELYNATEQRTDRVINTSISIGFLVYTCMSIFGYLTFLGTVSANIIVNYPNEPAIAVARIAMVLLVMFSYPLQTHPCRNSIDNLLFHRRNVSGTERSRVRLIIITLCVCFGTFLLGLFVEDIDIVFQFIGATGSTMLCYLLPGLFYLRMEKGKRWHLKKILAQAMVIIGVVVMIVANAGNIYGLVEG